MCGRITLRVSPRELRELFDVVRGLDEFNFEPRYNVAPTTVMACVRETPEGRELFPARWGLIPSWVKDKPPPSTFNARSDGVATKPMFRSAFKSRRCLVIASGFYEWRKLDAKNKQPHYVTLKSGAPMPMAGLWESWTSPEGRHVESCTIVTHTANDMMEPLHDRMPVILTRALISPWLDTSIKDPAAVQTLLGHYPSDEMQSWPVTQSVGNVRNQGPELIEPIDD